MTYEKAITVLERLRSESARVMDSDAEEALAFVLHMLREEKAHWDQQAEIAKRGGHGPASDF